jgi:hypothetical protein
MGDISDKAMASHMLDELAKPREQPRFTYAQFETNHLPWTRARMKFDYISMVPTHGLTGDNARRFEVYIQGVYELDMSIDDLAGGLTTHSKPAISAVFGDHLPRLGRETLSKLSVTDCGDPGLPRYALKLNSTAGLTWTMGLAPSTVYGFIDMHSFGIYMMQAVNISRPV